jgi:hypothetical protein
MPKVANAPKALNALLEKAYKGALKEYDNDKEKASKVAWAAAKSAGWKKDGDKWIKEKKEMADVSAKDFVIFKAGTWNGETFTETQLDEMAKNYNSADPPHIIWGHSSDYKGKTLIPSFGRIYGGLKRVGTDLVASGAKFNDEMAKWITDGFITDRSIELTKDNKKILAVGMLGAMSPAVKNMPLLKDALKDSALAFSEVAESKVIEFADAEAISMDAGAIDAAEEMGTEDTIKDMTESCMTFLAKVEENLNGDIDEDTKKIRIGLAIFDLSAELNDCMCLHFNFIDKLENIEEHNESEYSEKQSWKTMFTEMLNTFTKKRKENIVDTAKEKEYQDKILALETQVKTFSEKTEKEKADADALKVEVSDKLLRAEIKTFCETNKLNTNKHKEMKLEEILFATAKANQTVEFSDKDGKKEQKPLLVVLQDTLKTFQLASPRLGETDFSQSLTVEKGTNARLKAAEDYVKTHPTEFSEGNEKQKIAKALQMESNQQIHFTK